MSLLETVRRELLAPQSEPEDIDSWRSHVLSVILFVTVLLGTIVAVPSILLSLREKMWAVAFVDVLALAWVVMLWRGRGYSYRLRAWQFCALLYLLGLAMLLTVGQAGQIYLMGFPVMAALLLGQWPAIHALALNAATLLLVGYFTNADMQISMLESRPLLKWTVITINFVFVNALITFSIVLLLRGLEKTLERRRQSEEALRRLNMNLEKNVAERTRELEAFSYSVAHDLRGPLRAIDGYSQLVLSDNADKLDAESAGYLKRMRAASQRLGDLIDDLLALSKISRTELHRKEVDLAHMAEQVVAELRERHPGREVAFTAPAELKAQADPFLTRILFENLLGNAWKYTGKVSPARIEFGCSPADGPGTYFVRDNGAGFDMAYADKLFKPFHRLHDQNDFEGTGIGLSIVHRIVTRHEGRIWAEAKKGGGATFRFTLG
ncbi:MAG: Adaptive-response sensory-kinase SasA [Rhodocyclaceae bacterium]|jgi:signal transduction histidine kinase|nr:Adaptive-response sensory-kinase SasA [Rhodocyclaceae bacterium]